MRLNLILVVLLAGCAPRPLEPPAAPLTPCQEAAGRAVLQLYPPEIRAIIARDLLP